MTTTWQSIIEAQTQISPHTVSESTPCFMPLIQLSTFHVTGDEASSFLQNLFTNDVTALAMNQSQLNGFCNAKGRLLSLFLLIRRDEHYQIVLPKSMCTILQQRLSMYILRSKVTISDMSNDMVCVGLNNAIDPASLAEFPHKLEQRNISLTQYPHAKQRHLYIGNKEHAVDLCQLLLDQQWQLASEQSWNLTDIQAGLPMIFPESKEKFTPQQVNLDLVDGVSFKKGCYPGQEVVARLHYLGKPSRRMFLASAITTDLVLSGEEITDQDTKVIGHIVQAQIDNNGTIYMLLSLKLSDITKNAFIHNTIAITHIQSLENK